MKPIFIGIAGGTGAGKSTLCTMLMDKYPEQIGLIQLDDYFKPPEEKPKVGDIVSSDHPESLYLDKLASDLGELAHGKSVMISTKNERLNPEYKNIKKRILAEFKPKPVMLVEGFLVLHDERIRKFFSESFFLDVEHDTRWERRVHFKNDEYEQKVLIPMHQKYVEPSKQHATHVIDVTDLSKEKVFEKVEEVIKKYF